MRSRSLLFIIFIFSMFIAACTPKADELESGWQIYQNDELGISFDLPDTWVTQEENGVITIAVDQETLENQISSKAGASITLATAKDFDGFSEPGDILELFMDYFEYGRSDLEQISEPELITIQEQPASTVSYRGAVREQIGLFTATIISNQDHIALILTIDGSETDQYQDALDRITQSISLYTPIK